MKNVKFNDTIVKVGTIKDLAEKVKKSTDYIRKLEQRGVFPPANLRNPKGNVRVYSEQLINDLAAIMVTFRAGIPITHEEKTRINNAFMQEKITLKL